MSLLFRNVFVTTGSALDSSSSSAAAAAAAASLSSSSSSDSDSDYSDGVMATAARRKRAKDLALQQSLSSGLYPQFQGLQGPRQVTNPQTSNALDFLKLVWPVAVCELLAVETNRYATQNHAKGWYPTTASEMWVFIGAVLVMGIHVLPRLVNYWSRDRLLGVPSLANCISRARFRALLRNLHLVDNTSADLSDRLYKVRPLIEHLQRAFPACYNPGQELSIDEAMVKCKGRAKGKVYMPKKPVKRGFKIWCCSCSCCGYLCTFEVYSGRQVDPRTGRAVSEVGQTARVVNELLEPYEGENHVLYVDNFYSSGPLADELASKQIYIVGTIRRNAQGFPQSLRSDSVVPHRGDYMCVSVGANQYFVYHDRRVVRFISNVFPASMDGRVRLVQPEGTLVEKSVPPLLPAYNKYMGGVDLTDQLHKYYGFDRRCKRPWLRIFFHLLDFAVNNAHILYKHNCTRANVRPKDLLGFRLELAHLLLDETRQRKRQNPANQESEGDRSGECRLVKVSQMRMKRGRCFYCLRTKDNGERHCTSYGCAGCSVRLCKTPCFEEYHRQRCT